MALRTLKDLGDLHGKRVLMRVDFNVPLTPQGVVAEDARIRAAIPTINALIAAGAKSIILMSHLGRPKGKVDPRYSLAPVAQCLAQKLGKSVEMMHDCIGPDIFAKVSHLKHGAVVLLENVRFHPEEEANDPVFCAKLAQLGDVYVNDAFGTAHRAHASTQGVAKLIPLRAAGLLMERELAYLQSKINTPERPFVVILGGAKVSDKMGVIEVFIEKADKILIGGAMAYTFALAQGICVGKSLVEPDCKQKALDLIAKAQAKGVELLLPTDHTVTTAFDIKMPTCGPIQEVLGAIPKDLIGIDIGPKTVAAYVKALQGAKTILWNGPMGIFEIEAACSGTFAIAKAVAESEAVSIVGGGDSIHALQSSGFIDKITFVSTGGGASLELLEGKILPGVAVLEK
jgi:phosphoglycerate kinase